MKSLFVMLLALPGHLIALSQDQPRWLRYCSISPDAKTIAFSYRGDIYRVPAQGGAAMPLTIGADYEFKPVWSRDGKNIAYASDRSGNFDVYLVAAAGGEPKRLTWHSADEYPYDFDNTGSNILFGSVRLDNPTNRQFPSDALQELYSVPVAGGRIKQLLTTPAEEAKMSGDGRYIIYHDRKGRENPWRKHQVSSITRDVWLYDIKAKSHSKLAGTVFEDRTPVFDADQGFYYLSEADGNFNVFHRSLKDTARLRQVTFFKQYPVRFLSVAADGTVCFGYDGEIYVERPGQKPEKVPISIAIGKKEGDEKSVPIGEADELAVSPTGKDVAFTFRGEIFVNNVEGTAIKQITHTAGRERGISFSADGKRLLYASDRDNTWKIFEASIERKEETYFYTASRIRETALIANGQENYQPKFSPDGTEIAFVENRTTIRVFNLLSQKSRTILGSDYLYSRSDNDQYFDWSPDGKWLLIKYSEQGKGNDEVGIISASGKGSLINLTQSGYSDDRPKWMMHGGVMIWNSDRNGLHSYASGSTRQSDIYAMFFDRRLWEKFKLNKQEAALLKDTAKHPAGLNGNGQTAWDGLTTRKERLTTQSALLSDAVVTNNGEKLYYLAKFQKGYDLLETSLRTQETKMLLPLSSDEASLQLDHDQQNLYILSQGKISRINVLTGKRDFISTKGAMQVNTAAERKNMYEYIWRRTKETFYAAGMHGTPWDLYKTGYAKYLPFIDNNYDFSEMLNELLGELNVSHTGANYDFEKKDGDKTASLGVFYDDSYNGTGVKIQEIMEDGPLDNPAFNIGKGTIIEAIDGEKITNDRDFAFWLNKKEGRSTLLTLRTFKGTQQVSIKPISLEDEWKLIYNRWIKRNEEETDKLSQGQLGYVHLYRMNDEAYRNTYEKVLGKYGTKKGIVVDTRFNRGGDLASDLVMFLTGRKTRNNTSDHFLVSTEPLFRWTKPSVLLACEANYSDGACFAFDYRMLNMGKLVGMPVPGSCTWMTGQSLQDESMHFSVPALGVKTIDGRYMENVQLLPDIQVMNSYKTVSEGRDIQLEKAIEELMKETEK